MAAGRGQFSSRLGFIMAAAGSAVGLGNIWGFPTQAASNGGAAFLLVYLALAFTLAYPALMAELVIGRHGHANAVGSLRSIARGRATWAAATGAGLVGLVVASLILAFYAIVAGWMIAHCLASVAAALGADTLAAWLRDFSLARNAIFTAVFMIMTKGIIARGVEDGIERWSTRLMPLLLMCLVLLAVYVLRLDGATRGLRLYLLPDFRAVLEPDLIVSALGAAFFSLSLGVGTMLVYGSYLKDDENLPVAGAWVTVVDIVIAVTAGFLVLPAMTVAELNGVEIYTDAGQLMSEDTLIFAVLPALFDSMGLVGDLVAATFFFLLTIASLTSSISMLEVPVAFAVEDRRMPRPRAALLIGGAITLGSLVILLFFEPLFGWVVAGTTRYSQPLLGIVLCLFAGWIWRRAQLLEELEKGFPGVEHTWFWRLWPRYVGVVCPAIILLIFTHSLLPG